MVVVTCVFLFQIDLNPASCMDTGNKLFKMSMADQCRKQGLVWAHRLSKWFSCIRFVLDWALSLRTQTGMSVSKNSWRCHC